MNMKNLNIANANLKNTLTSAIGSLVVSGLAFSSAVQADSNPFGATELSSGYMVLAEGSCGEGKCGANAALKEKKSEGSCGEGKCGGDKKEMNKTAEGSCGEGKCGGDKKEMNKTTEGSCGEGKCGGDKKEMNKTTEGSCGEGKCGGKA